LDEEEGLYGEGGGEGLRGRNVAGGDGHHPGERWLERSALANDSDWPGIKKKKAQPTRGNLQKERGEGGAPRKLERDTTGPRKGEDSSKLLGEKRGESEGESEKTYQHLIA